MNKEMSLIRKFLFWWFGYPLSASVSVNIAIDFTEADRFLKEYNDTSNHKVTIQHLIMASIAKSLMKVPEANSRIINGRIYPQDQVGIAYPINLLGHKGGEERELSMGILGGVDTLTLEEIASQCSQSVQSERQGTVGNPFVRTMMRMMKRLPDSLVKQSFDQVNFWMRRPAFAEQVYKMMPVTTAISNPGSVFSKQEGVVFRGGSLNIPDRLLYVGTLWGVSTVQEEVISVQGEPQVRRMLPVMLVFDHRLIDGVKAGELLLNFSKIIRDPADYL